MGVTLLGGPMRQQSATTRELEARPDASWAGDHVTCEVRAWFWRRLRWERRLAELHTQAEGAHGAPTALRAKR
jgi:hypothetical protein